MTEKGLSWVKEHSNSDDSKRNEPDQVSPSQMCLSADLGITRQVTYCKCDHYASVPARVMNLNLERKGTACALGPRCYSMRANWLVGSAVSWRRVRVPPGEKEG